MLYDSAFQAGAAGMQQSQSRLQQTQHAIARLNTQSSPQPRANSIDAAPMAAAGASVADLATQQIVPQSAQVPSADNRSNKDLSELLIEQKREQILFDASARVLNTASQTMGRLINEWS